MYSTGCPRCSILEKKLVEKGVEFEKVTSTEEIKKEGIDRVPVLKVDGVKMEYVEAVNYVNGLEGKR